MIYFSKQIPSFQPENILQQQIAVMIFVRTNSVVPTQNIGFSKKNIFQNQDKSSQKNRLPQNSISNTQTAKNI